MSTAAANTLINSHCDQPSTTARVSAPIQSAVRTLRLWRTRFRDRHAFPVLDERDLRDLRLSRWEVDRELAKPFWRG
ncbi:MAG: hypothetical protein ABSE20_11455 [Acetobacteraceae bacterium]|jgi:uncharacterized protein YjiS (DUF1127 family)